MSPYHPGGPAGGPDQVDTVNASAILAYAALVLSLVTLALAYARSFTAAGPAQAEGTPVAPPGPDRRSGWAWKEDAPACTGPGATMRARSYHADPGACQASVLCISL